MFRQHSVLLIVIAALTLPVIIQASDCVTSCSGRPDGYYQSCNTCAGFVQCGNGRTWEMPCAPGTVWDDSRKTCNFESITCGEPKEPPRCGTPPWVANGRFDSQDGDPQTAILTCKDGYEPIQQEYTITCDKGSWPRVPNDICQRITPRCGKPPSVPNGMFRRQDSDSQSATLQCKPGFAPSQQPYIIECEEGSWPSVPENVCTKVIPRCGRPPSVPNGRFLRQDSDVQSAILSCKTGFAPSQQPYIIECEEGSWPSVPENVCTKVIPRCGRPPSVPNGRFLRDDQSATLRCKTGFAPSQQPYIIECEEGSWPSVPENVCTKVIPRCGRPPSVPNGRFLRQDSDVQSAILSCKTGFAPSQQPYIIECEEGSWPSVPENVCTKVDPPCKGFPEVKNGEFVAKDNKDEQKNVPLVCDEEFKLSEPGFTITCKNGVWTNVPKDICIPDGPPCGDPPPVLNGKFIRVGYKMSATLECYEHYKPTIPEFNIMCNGTSWPDIPEDLCVPDIPSCDDVPSIEYGRFIPDLNHTTALLKCDNEYRPSVGKITCDDGEWVGGEGAECILDVNPTCGLHPNISNGVFETWTDLDSARLKCDPGYMPTVPDYTINCTDGSWPKVPDNICISVLVKNANGRDFYVAFFENFNSKFSGTLTIYLASSEPGTVTISSDLIQTAEYSVDGISATKVHIEEPEDFLLVQNDRYKVSKKVIRIRSSVDINVYAYNGQTTTSDATSVFPVHSLGKEYILAAGRQNPSAAIIGTAPRTFVNITYPHGTFKYARLGPGEVFYIPGPMSPGSFKMTGTLITSSKPVAVFTGNKCTRVPLKIAACDTLIEQVPCVSSLQSVYVLSYMYPRPAFRCQVVATEDGTVVEIGSMNGTKTTHTIHRREDVFQDFTANDTIYVTSTKPVMVAQYAFGQGFDHKKFGDPSLMIIPGVGQYESKYLFTSLGDTNLAFSYERVYLIVKKELRSGLRLDGKEFVGELEIDIQVPGYADYVVVYVEMTQTVEQRLTHVDGKPFGALQYGAAPYNEYGFALGFKLKPFAH